MNWQMVSGVTTPMTIAEPIGGGRVQFDYRVWINIRDSVARIVQEVGWQIEAQGVTSTRGPEG